jgi:AcrR family transcriptional regulator
MTPGAKPTSSARERQREDTRQRVYEAAMNAFRRDGVGAARIDDIARAAGVSHGTFYFHFATKEDVLAQRLRQSETVLAEALESLPVDAPLTIVLETLGSIMGDEWQGEPELFPEVGAVALRNVSTQVTAGRSSPVRAALAGRFAIAADRGELSRALPPEVLSDLLLVHVFAAALSWCSAPAMPLARMLHDVAMLFLHGAQGRRGG